MSLRFSKMHGIGNDFVVVDRRAAGAPPLDAALVAAMADRHTGVGFDQLLALERPRRSDCHAAYRIFNADGSTARQCGNGVRCLVAWLARAGELGTGAVRLEGPTGPVDCERLQDGQVRVRIGVPRFEPADLPFLGPPGVERHTLERDGARIAFRIVSIGNPHAVLEVDDVATAPVAAIGPWLESHAAFPDRVNVGFAAVRGRHAIDLRVHERGVGETRGCGSGAAAAAAVLLRAGQVESPVAVRLPGGMLSIDWAGVGHQLAMTGPAAFVFEAEWNP